MSAGNGTSLSEQCGVNPPTAEADSQHWCHVGCEGVWGAKNDEELGKHTYVEDSENGNLVKEMPWGRREGGNQEGQLFGAFKGLIR
jgi:hypothetical protein